MNHLFLQKRKAQKRGSVHNLEIPLDTMFLAPTSFTINLSSERGQATKGINSLLKSDFCVKRNPPRAIPPRSDNFRLRKCEAKVKREMKGKKKASSKQDKTKRKGELREEDEEQQHRNNFVSDDGEGWTIIFPLEEL